MCLKLDEMRKKGKNTEDIISKILFISVKKKTRGCIFPNEKRKKDIISDKRKKKRYLE